MLENDEALVLASESESDNTFSKDNQSRHSTPHMPLYQDQDEDIFNRHSADEVHQGLDDALEDGRQSNHTPLASSIIDEVVSELLSGLSEEAGEQYTPTPEVDHSKLSLDDCSFSSGGHSVSEYLVSDQSSYSRVRDQCNEQS